MTTNISNACTRIWHQFALGMLFLGLFGLNSCANIVPDCNACSSPPLTQLQGRWELLRWNRPPDAMGKITLRTIPHGDNGEPIIIEFNEADKRLSGYSGCNRFFSPITTDAKGAIVLGKIGATMRMCVEPYRMELEHDFLNQLDDYRSLNTKGNELLLVGRTGDVLVFGRRGPP
jgi:heat shock protein HslJ